jgi:hypothetical protein
MSFDLIASQGDNSPMSTTNDSITIRMATAGDDAALANLAGLDSARPLRGDVLVAEADGRISAAISLADQRFISDPFSQTADLVALLRARAQRLEAPGTGGLRPLARRLLPA